VVVVVVEGVVVSGGDSVVVGGVDWFGCSVGEVVVVVVEDSVRVLAFCPQPTTGVNISRKAMTSARKQDTRFMVAPPSS
jgi:hypothetical protein